MKDCTLDKLHEHIQTCMGWTNSHLHHFQIGEQLYGDPMLIEENMEEMDYEDFDHNIAQPHHPREQQAVSVPVRV